MKKKLSCLSIALCASITFNSYAQELKQCGTTEAMNEVFAKDPTAKARLEAIEAETRQIDQDLFHPRSGVQNQKLNNITQNSITTYTIPVVFHILCQTPAENISNAQVLDAVAILNRDYRKLNAGTANIVPGFQSLAADIGIEFRLATKDPNGN